MMSSEEESEECPESVPLMNVNRGHDGCGLDDARASGADFTTSTSFTEGWSTPVAPSQNVRQELPAMP